MKKKLVLFVIGSLDIGGTEKHLIQILPLLNKKTRRYTVLCLFKKGTLAKVLQKKSIPVIPLLSKKENKILKWAPKILAIPFVIFKIIKVLKKEKPYILHLFLPISYYLGSAAALFFRPPKIIMSRRSLCTYQKKIKFCRLIEKLFHKKTDLLLGNCKKIYHELCEECGDKKKVKLIFNGIKILKKQRKKNNIKKLTMAIVANILPYKGHLNLIEALHLINKKLPPWQLLVVGKKYNPFWTKLEKLISGYKMHKKVICLGQKNNLDKIYSKTQIAISASNEEGLSNSILEFMNRKIPVIATNVGGSKDLILHNKTGILVPPQNPKKLSEEILKLSYNTHKQKKIASKAFNRLKTKFSLHCCVQKYNYVYDTI